MRSSIGLVLLLLAVDPSRQAAAQETPVVLTRANRTGGNFLFEISGTNSAPCQIQATDVLTGPWTDLSPAVSPAVFPIDRPNRFFRIKCDSVYSVNAVGYVTLTIPPGFSLVANPLSAQANTVAALFAGLPDSAVIYKFDQTRGYSVNAYLFGQWTDPAETLVPGEGAFLYQPGPGPVSMLFVGEVAPRCGPSDTLPAGFSIISSRLPISGSLGSQIGFPAREFDVVYLFNPASQSYDTFQYILGAFLPTEPIVNIGQAFFVNLSEARPWCRIFELP